MPRARLCLLIPLGLFACKRSDGPSETTTPVDAHDGSDDETAAIVSGDGLPIVAMPQRVISIDPLDWSFDPSGRFVAAEFEDEDAGAACGVWDIESGTLVRSYYVAELDDEGDDFDPCIDWLDDSDPHSSADGKLRARFGKGLEIESDDGTTKSLPGCTSCGDALVWAPSGHQLATCNGERLEIWDADAGVRLHVEQLGIQDVGETLLGWSADGLGAVVLHDVEAPCEELEPEGSYCYGYGYDEDEGEVPLVDGSALSSFWWPAGGGPARTAIEFYKSVEIPDVHTDLGLHWVAFNKETSYDRDGVATELFVIGTGDRSSALGWTDDDDDAYEEAESWEGHWRVDTATQWIEGQTVGSADYSSYGTLEVGWTALVAEPNPALFHGQLGTLEGRDPFAEVEVLAAGGGSVVARWEGCAEGEDAGCGSGGPPVGDCELLDVSPSLSLSLVDCESGLRLLEASGRGRTVASLANDPASQWRWGRGNYLALLEPGGKLGVVDVATGKPLYTRDKVTDMLEIPLGPEQDRLALAYADHLEIVAGPSGDSVIDVPGDWEAAALSPDGEQLAVLGSKKVQVIDIASAATITTIDVDDAFGVAWRQDGAALFYGYDWPTHAVDPKTGQLLYEVDDPVFEVFDPEEIDPSWRWVHRPDGSVIRTLDFARIELGPGWARIASGMFEGEREKLPADLGFRVGDDPEALPIYTTKQLEPWLHAPGLVAAFFLGKPLPSPRIPAEAAAKLGTKG